MTGFWTLLGPDFAGKSTLLRQLRDERACQVVSYDDWCVAERFPAIRRLRREWVLDVYPRVGQEYSPAAAVAMLRPIVRHLHDQVARAADDIPVVVDSYYYKLLVKCRLLGLVHERTFAEWRALPQPEGVIYLDLPPEVAWERAQWGSRLNAFEHYGPVPGWEGFAELQSRMRPAIMEEIAGLPLVVLDARAGQRTVAAEAGRVLASTVVAP
ncbi:dTMP kinase [Streptosporangium roseum]|uniref:dTMP kinase n=1 Tax=Streptosporangium roseum TaxID=2001 RepID=UPI00069120FD|nr:hypothetical protein [Streptosporangium roseum]